MSSLLLTLSLSYTPVHTQSCVHTLIFSFRFAEYFRDGNTGVDLGREYF